MYVGQKHALEKLVDFLIGEGAGPFGHIVKSGGSFLANHFLLHLHKNHPPHPGSSNLLKAPDQKEKHAAHHLIDRLWPHIQSFEKELSKRDRANLSISSHHQSR